MGAKQYLQQVKRLDEIMNAKMEQIQALRSISMKITTYYSGMERVQTTQRNDRLSEAVARVTDMEDELNNDIDKLVDLKIEIMQKIDEVKNNDYRLLLTLRYLNFKTWANISLDMNYDVTWIYELHRRALKEFEESVMLFDDPC